MALHNITTRQEFEEKVLKSKKIVLVDFWAAWCPPCLAMAPALHDLAEELDATVDIVKVDIEATADSRELAIEHGVQSIPNMPIFVGGKEAARIIGLSQKGRIAEILTKLAV